MRMKAPVKMENSARADKVIYYPLAELVQEVRSLDRMHLNKELDAIAGEADAAIAVQAGVVNRLERLLWKREAVSSVSRASNSRGERTWQECFPSDEDRDPYL